MVTRNIISRVFHLRGGNSTGTCFVIDVDEKQYFVTAKHVLPNLNKPRNVEIYFMAKWETIEIYPIGESQKEDVLIFATNVFFERPPVATSSNGILLGQDVYFLGYPYQLMSPSIDLNADFPMPFIKKATLSAIYHQNDLTYMWLDGINNPGFSGGPVVYAHHMYPNQPYHICGVISGFLSMPERGFIGGQQTPIEVRLNTGIINAIPIESALALITANPDGHTPYRVRKTG